MSLSAWNEASRPLVAMSIRWIWVMPSSLRCTVVIGMNTASSWSVPQAVAPFLP